MKLMDYYSSGEHLLIHADKTKFILLYLLAHCLHHCKNHSENVAGQHTASLLEHWRTLFFTVHFK